MNHIITEYDLEDIKECPICMVEYVINDTTNITSCGHIFHNNCLSKWELKQKENEKKVECPICRKNYNKKYFDRQTIQKWTEKGKNFDLQNNNFLEKLSVKSLRNISKSLNLDINGCYDKNDFLQILNNYFKICSLKNIKNFLKNEKVDFSNLVEKKELLLLYMIYIIRTCGN